MNPSTSIKFVVLAVLDGWGIAPAGPGNAISQAATPNMDRFMVLYPHTSLNASGEAVGLPRGEPGNTETGHLNLGAGRIVYQDLARINMSIADGSFFTNPVILQAIEHTRMNNSNLHLMGLIGAGGVHSNIEHLYALMQAAKRANFNRVFLHLFTDGRDSPPTSAKTYVSQVRAVIAKEGLGQIATVMGRYWAMDRDLRWERSAKAYFALTGGEGHLVRNAEEAIDMSYSQGKTDEFIEPSVITNFSGKPLGVIRNDDAVVFFNFRIDRPRQLSRAFVLQDFTALSIKPGFDPYLVKYKKSHRLTKIPPALFERGRPLTNLFFATMTEYEKSLVENGARVVFPPQVVENPLGKVISDSDNKQLRIAESEKERFVTFYFNGQQEIPFPGEERLIIPSPKVAAYDLKPEMSANEITEQLLAKLRDAVDYKFILVNFANPDMVGHTGNIGAAVKGCETVDGSLGKIANFVLAYEGAMVITGDHGKAEEMISEPSGEIQTEHSRNLVPFVVISKNLTSQAQTLATGILADVAPTVLQLLGLKIPSSMTGRNLLQGI